MSADHTPDSLFDSFSQDGTPYRPIPTHTPVVRRSSTASSSSSHQPTSGVDAPVRQHPRDSDSYENGTLYPVPTSAQPFPVTEGYRDDWYYRTHVRPIEERIRARAERSRLNDEQAAQDEVELGAAVPTDPDGDPQRRKPRRGKRRGGTRRGDDEGELDELDELFEIPRARTRDRSDQVDRRGTGKGNRNMDEKVGGKMGRKGRGKGKSLGVGVGGTGMRPFEDDPSLRSDRSMGSDSDVESDSVDLDEDDRGNAFESGSEGDASKKQMEADVLESIGLSSTASTHHDHDRPGHAHGESSTAVKRAGLRTREPGWKGPREARALKHGPIGGPFDPDNPNPDLQTLHDITTHTLRSTAFLYADRPYASGSPAGLFPSSLGASSKLGYVAAGGVGRSMHGQGGWGVRGARGKFGVGISPRTG